MMDSNSVPEVGDPVSIYETAGAVYGILDRLSRDYDCPAIEKLVPHLNNLFGQLELVAMGKDGNKTEDTKKELVHYLNRIEIIKSERLKLIEKFDIDFEGVISEWRKESGDLEAQISQLRAEIEQLNIELGNREFDLEHFQSGNSVKERKKKDEEYFAQIAKVIAEMKEQICFKEDALATVHKELDLKVAELRRIVSELREAKTKNCDLRTKYRKVTEEKDTLEAEHENLQLRLAQNTQEITKAQRELRESFWD